MEPLRLVCWAGVNALRSEVMQDEFGPYFDLSSGFGEGIFAYVSLRGGQGHEPADLESFLARRGHGGTSVVAVNQVHGCRVAGPEETPCEADGVLVETSGRAARVVTADCVPLLLARRDGSACAAVHAGWRGTLEGIALQAAGRLSESGRRPLSAYIGPAIGSCCYEVSEDLAARFRERFGALPGIPEPGDPPRLDLKVLNAQQLLDAGVPASEIRVEERCTACSIGLCWSYRRDGPGTGRLASLIGREADVAGSRSSRSGGRVRNRRAT